jgi:hypothetical protein
MIELSTKECDQLQKIVFGKETRSSRIFMEMEYYVLCRSIPHRFRSGATTLDNIASQCVSIMRNLHRSDHSKKCFKSKGGECRMKIPSPPLDHISIVYDEKPIKWYDWKGKMQTRKLFLVIPKRTAADVFANIHNETVTSVLGCNNNVAACFDGGSPMYCTAYQSKNTQIEDSAKSTEAAKHMISKMNQCLQEMMTQKEEDDTDMDELDRTCLGLKTMIGAVLMSTNAHVCGAPLAAFLIRNQSRFWFSHDFSYLRLDDFLKSPDLDKEFATDENGNPFLKSTVCNYVRRPLALDSVCLYDFLSYYTVCKPNAESLHWCGNHPSTGKLAVTKLKQGKYRIPKITYLDFVDTKDFQGDLLESVFSETTQIKHVLMEQYCANSALCFIPFRNVECDLKTNGTFHSKFVEFVQNGRLTEKHELILENIQTCRNSLNAGRPKDWLERNTINPSENNPDFSGNTHEHDDGDIFEEILGSLVEETIACDNFKSPSFRNNLGHLCFESKQTTAFGTYKCGTSHCQSPDVATFAQKNVIIEDDENTNENSSGHTREYEYPTAQSLHELNTRRTERVVDDSCKYQRIWGGCVWKGS